MIKLPNQHPYIARVDRPDRRMLGWEVHVLYEGRRFRRLFQDKRFHGREGSYAAAQHFALELGNRSEFLALLRRLKPRQNSRSGTPGVARYEGGPGRGPFWLAYWDEDGRKIQKKFSITAYGEDRARELAFKTRCKAVTEHARRFTQIRKHEAPILKSLTRTRSQPLSAP